MAGGAEVDVYVDGELLDTVDQDSSGLDYQEAWGYCGLESGQTHVLVFRQNTGTLMDVDAFFLENNPISDDDNQLISYGIGWISYLGNGPYDGSIHYSEMVGSQAEVTFSGTSVGLFYTSSSNRGVLQIQIDGVTVAYLNQYAVETQYQQYWTATGLRDGTHKITFIHASGTIVDIDGIWVEELLPERFTGAEYTYDGDGNMVKSEVNGVVTYYLGKYYEKTVQNGHYAEKKHYSAGSSMIAVRTVIDGTQDTLNWLVGDHLGSTSLVTDSAGAVVNEVRYSAFGEMRYLDGETVTDLLYTGQKLDSYINLYWYGSRWYDNELGRFIQPDSLVPNPGASWAYDRYSYVGNNPIRYNDPNGHYRISGGGPPYPNPTPSPGYDPETVLDPTPAKTPEPINSGNPAVISPAPVPEPWVFSVAPPGEFDDEGNYLGGPPDVEGLSEDEWEFGNFPNSEPGSFRHPADPGYVWSPHEGKVSKTGAEGEAPHWHRRVPGSNRRGEIYPPNPEWGRGTNDRSGPGVYNPETGRYESGRSTNYGKAAVEIFGTLTFFYAAYQAVKWTVGLSAPPYSLPVLLFP